MNDLGIIVETNYEKCLQGGSFCQYLGFDTNSEKDVFSWPHTRYVSGCRIKKQFKLDVKEYDSKE